MARWSRKKRDEPKIRICLADDQAEIRRVLNRFLSRDDRFDLIGEASDGSEAITLVRDKQPDVVILDLAMPQLDGLAAIPRVLEASPRTKIVIFSSMAPFGDTTTQAMDLGAAAVFDKYVRPKRLMDEIVALMEGS